MAITSSAKRAIRVSLRKRLTNVKRSDAMKDSMKALRKLAESGNKVDAEKAIAGVYKAIDKAAKRGVIKKNTAARKKSRIVAYIKKQLEKPVVAKAPKAPKVAKVAKPAKESK